jgi:hypothetical protein
VAAFGELSVGITVTPNGQRALAALEPRLEETYLTIEHQNPWEYLTTFDGFRKWETAADNPRTLVEDLISQLRLAQGFRAGRRSDLVDAMVKLVGECASRHVSAVCSDARRWADLTIHDGSTAEADVGESLMPQ